jgi:hypothetical protein
MLKGLCALLALAVVLAASHQLQAQVYRCEGASGVTYSDMPCGASAEEVVVAGNVLDMRGLGAAVPAEPVDEAVTAGAGTETPSPDQSGQDLSDFLVMLRSQRQQQIGEIDNQLTQLRQQAGSAEFLEMAVSEQDELNRQIGQLESDRASIVSEYDALIAEAERRLE